MGEGMSLVTVREASMPEAQGSEECGGGDKLK